MTGPPRPGAAGIPDLIRRAAICVQSASFAGTEQTSALLDPEFADVFATWLLEAAAREGEYRRLNPDWTPAGPAEEAWTAGLLAAQLLGVDPAHYDITTPGED